MDAAELVGGVLFDAPDPVHAADQLAQLLISDDRDSTRASQLGFEPDLVAGLRHALPDEPVMIRIACAQGAGWVIGRRSLECARNDSWEPVATLRVKGGLPRGLRRTTAETLIALTTEATHRLRLSAPFVDSVGIGFVADALAAATSRGVSVELWEPQRSDLSSRALTTLQRIFASRGTRAGCQSLGLAPTPRGHTSRSWWQTTLPPTLEAPT